MIDKYRRNFPKLYLTLEVAKRLPEYSGSFPTGKTIGKRWRRHDGVFDSDLLERGGVPIWMIGEYAEADDPKYVRIKWYRLCIRKPAGRGPATPPQHRLDAQ